MNRALRFPLVLLLTALPACSDDPVEPDLTDDASIAMLRTGVVPANRLGVMTRNMYVGADLDVVIGALVSPDPADDFPAIMGAIATLEATDYPARAVAMAAEIELTRPDVVGLQEVSQLHIDLTPFGVPVRVDLDFLPVLQAELAVRGLDYTVAVTHRNIEAAPLPGISLVDFDAILVDARRVRITSVEDGTFGANIGVVAPGVELKRGWVLVRGSVNDLPFTVVNTHLESGNAPGVADLRAAQAIELTSHIVGDPRAIVLGDLNDVPGSAMYQVLSAAGLIDVWRDMRPGVDGFTCCHRADLSNRLPELDRRLDYVFARGMARHPRGFFTGSIGLIGARATNRAPGPSNRFWPSDHAGVVAEMIIPKGIWAS